MAQKSTFVKYCQDKACRGMAIVKLGDTETTCPICGKEYEVVFMPKLIQKP